MNGDGHSLTDPRTSDKLPPHNLEAEGGMLASLMLENDLIHEVAAFLTPDDLYRDSHRKVFEAILSLADEGKPTDCVMVAEELIRRGQYRDMGGDEFLREVMEGHGTSHGAIYYGRIVREKSVARRLIEQCNEISRLAYSNTLTADDLTGDAERRILSVGESAVQGDPVPLAHAAARSMSRMDARENGSAAGLSTSFPDLDAVTDGFQPRKLYILAARPSIGKSALALNAADYAGREGGVPVLFVSLEMDAGELADRYLMSRAEVDGACLRRPSLLAPTGRARLNRAVSDAAEKSRLTIDDPSHITITQLAARARRHKHRHGLGLLVVDYLQLVDGQSRKGDNREQEIARISRRLKGLAKELVCPVLALCQLNRTAESREDRRPRLSDLRESGQIEQDADCVMLLHRPDFYDPNDHPGEAFVIVAKNRGGRTGQVQLRYVPAQTRFETWAEHIAPADSPF